MNSSVRIGDLQRWQMCAGMCLVCGQPLGLSDATKTANKVLVSAAKQEDSDFKNQEQETFLESLSLSEECPVRLCMMRFRILGKREECHVIDRYTHLEKGSSDERFDRVLEKKKDSVAAVGAPYQEPLRRMMLKTDQFENAMAICRRVAKPFTFSGCRACNMAMEKASAHANAIYRCFPLTARVDIAALEENTQESIKTKKILEQIALFFEWNADEWTAKGDERLLQDAYLWRCIAHLYCWGRNTKFRSRLVATFHAANYLFAKSSWKGSVIFEDWHIHIFQPFYMQLFPANTWFGVHQGEAAAMFDFARKEGPEWMQWVGDKLELHVLPELEKWAEREIQISKIQNFKDRISNKAHSEKHLLELAIQKKGTQKGLESLFAFYLFNVKEEAAHRQHFETFMQAIGKTLLQFKLHQK